MSHPSLPWLGAAALACGAADSDPAAAPDSPATNSSALPDSVVLAPLAEVPGSVPAVIELHRRADRPNLYRVVLRSHLVKVDGRVPQTGCVEADLWLMPHDYGVTLPVGRPRSCR